VRVVSPLELQVLEGDRVLGSTADGPIIASAGRHELEFVNNAFGYRDRRVITLKPGEVMSVSIPHPEGRISINAVPWADVWIDNQHVGETPLANLAVPIGQHEVSFRHPSYGEQKRTTIVRHDTPTRISADLR
jgi:PEGA domain-containing protein